MPGSITGRQLGDILRAQRPDLPIVYTSGYSAEVTEGSLDLSPTRRFLPKPFTCDGIAAYVRACLDASPTTDAPPTTRA